MKKIYEDIANQWLTIEAAAKYLGVSQDTLRRWEKKAKLVPRRTMGGHRRYRRRQLEEILRQPLIPILQHNNLSYQNKEYQKSSTTLSIPPIPPISRHQTITNNYKKPQSNINNLKDILPTLLIVITIIALVIGSCMLLQAVQTSSRNKEQFISPVPQTRITP